MKLRRTVDLVWEVEDGYAGGSRPHTSEIDLEDVEHCETEDELMAVLDEIVGEDFTYRISWYYKEYSLDRLIDAWALRREEIDD